MTLMTAAAPSTPSFGSALGHVATDKRVEILRLIGQRGSISQAAREASVSYKAAWQAVDTLTNLAGVALVECAVGGSGGGGARLTPAGEQLLAAARFLGQARSEMLARFSQSADPPRPALAGIGVRTSMRNQFVCEVSRLRVQGQVVRVQLRLAGGAELVSRITKASAELLALRKHQEVLALCKASAVGVFTARPDASAPTASSAQLLQGQVVRISRGKEGDEVSLVLSDGHQLVGFAVPGTLRSRAHAIAHIDESALVIALTA